MLSSLQSLRSSEAPVLPAPVVLEAGGYAGSLDDILAAAAWRGELDAFRSRWETIQAAATRTEALGQFPEPAAVEAATNEFRYARDLVSAEECEDWLAARGLTFADLTACVTRRLQAEMAAQRDGLSSPSASVEDASSANAGEATAAADGKVRAPGPIDLTRFRTDALLADEFTGWARGLAWRLALACERQALPPADADPATQWAALEEPFQSAGAALATPERRRRELTARRLDLLRVAVTAAEFADLAAAREACLCAREDGLALAEVARANSLPFTEWEAFLSDLSPDWQRALMSTALGDATPPLTEGENAVVLQLRGKREPSPDDAAVAQRLDAAVRRQHFGELEARHIRWRLNVDLEASA
jgi:hypothetical protein